jgi:hypothetical protein
MKEQSLSSKEILLNIGSMRGHTMKLLNLTKPYSKLLDQVLTHDFVHDEETPVPSIKELAQMSGLRYEAVRKQLQAIYHDLIFGEDRLAAFSFPIVGYSFYIRGLTKGKTLHVEVDRLPIIPRVGEGIQLPFFSAYLGTKQFHVEKVEHEFGDGKQEIVIWIREGSYNSYWHYRKDKAMEENEVGLLDFFRLDEYELKRKLNVGRY